MYLDNSNTIYDSLIYKLCYILNIYIYIYIYIQKLILIMIFIIIIKK